MLLDVLVLWVFASQFRGGSLPGLPPWLMRVLPVVRMDVVCMAVADAPACGEMGLVYAALSPLRWVRTYDSRFMLTVLG